MRLLLDTHALLWWLADDPALSRSARDAIAAADSEVFVSAASAWEISIKTALGKLTAPSDLEHQLQSSRFEPLSITIAHGYAAGSLPRHHDDPFDRLLLAQAKAEDLVVVTRDRRFDLYGVGTLAA